MGLYGILLRKIAVNVGGGMRPDSALLGHLEVSTDTSSRAGLFESQSRSHFPCGMPSADGFLMIYACQIKVLKVLADDRSWAVTSVVFHGFSRLDPPKELQCPVRGLGRPFPLKLEGFDGSLGV